ncbi:uncharacterized protein LOC131601145 isoform X2 [Vicia villosa]|uniref:uncharacterized protein LOC131601145 isoform X2 n=2 Tax=Vicia villosa TaxID=3911 RepID=UPI00273BF027|nr:uncharacterized protein LOC131601145 isoform X2 [Vicia villosa]
MQFSTKDAAERTASSVVKGLLKKDGIHGLYKGFATVLTGTIPARIVFLTFLETIKEASFKMVKPFELSETIKAAIANGIVGMASSLVSQAVYTPIDVIRQKLMVKGCSGHAQYSSGLDVAWKLIRSEGFRGLYRGFTLLIQNLLAIRYTCCR